MTLAGSLIASIDRNIELWEDARLVYLVAAAPAAMLLFTVWLFRRRGRGGRQAGAICLVLSIGLHAALILLVPMLPSIQGGSSTSDSQTDEQSGFNAISLSTFNPDMAVSDAAGAAAESMITPLPVSTLTDSLLDPTVDTPVDNEQVVESEPITATIEDAAPRSLISRETTQTSGDADNFDSTLGDFLDDALAAPPRKTETPVEPKLASDPESSEILERTGPGEQVAQVADQASLRTSAPPPAVAAMVPGAIENDFANRVGKAKEGAIARTGGDADTETAVQAALKFLAEAQRADGAWDPRASGAGKELAPLGMTRGGAGAKAETALTGLALLALMGSGQTHQQGEYRDNVYRGLAYLIGRQEPDGSLSGPASVYAANYSHGIAALAMCEAAAITRDASAIESATRSIRYTRGMQHSVTGGWRYTAGDPGDLSQLGWQAMVLDAGFRAGVPMDARSVRGVEKFLRTVRAGAAGGLASYRGGEAPSRTMTAEALATRLLIGESVPVIEIAEAEHYLLQQIPGVGQDNYYYWYYATLALHQLQDPAWEQWNAALKRRLLATQRPDGSWPADTVWGGYGGTVYTTAMATLCLEVYYRHAIRGDSQRIANQTQDPIQR